jgi:rhodanese-related sulfurtransferase
MDKNREGQAMRRVLIYAALAAMLALSGCAPTAESPAATTAAEAATAPAWKSITPGDARALIGRDDVVLLDVRTQEEFGEAHIGGAVLLPYDAIAADSGGLPADKAATVIVYCRSGRRSAIAAETLANLGYTSVYDLGGIQSWPYETVS